MGIARRSCFSLYSPPTGFNSPPTAPSHLAGADVEAADLLTAEMPQGLPGKVDAAGHPPLTSIRAWAAANALALARTASDHNSSRPHGWHEHHPTLGSH